MTILRDLINTVRNLRGEMNLNPSIKAPLFIESTQDLQEFITYIPAIARLSEIKQVTSLPTHEDAPIAICNGARLMLKVEIDKNAERTRLHKEIEKVQKNLDKLNAKLNKPGYVDKAPPHLVEKDRMELAELNSKMEKIQGRLINLNN